MPIIVAHEDPGTTLSLAAMTGAAVGRAEQARQQEDRLALQAADRIARYQANVEDFLRRRNASELARMDRESRLAEFSTREANELALRMATAQERAAVEAEKRQAMAKERQDEQATMLGLWSERFGADPRSPEALDALAKITAGDTPNLNPRAPREGAGVSLPGTLGGEIAASVEAGDIAALTGRLGEGLDEFGSPIPGTMTREARLARAAISQLFADPATPPQLIDRLRKDVEGLPPKERSNLLPIFEQAAEQRQRDKAERIAPAVADQLPDILGAAFDAFRSQAESQGVNIGEMTVADRIGFDAMVLDQVLAETGLTPAELDRVLTIREAEQRRKIEAEQAHARAQFEQLIIQQAIEANAAAQQAPPASAPNVPQPSSPGRSQRMGGLFRPL